MGPAAGTGGDAMSVGAPARSDAELGALLAGGPDAQRRVLLRGATIISMDPAVGDHERADLLIEGRRIAAIGPDLSDAVADGRGITLAMEDMILIPGMQDTHRHCWQNQLRRLIPDADLADYMELTHHTHARFYRPEDFYAGGVIAAASAIDGGVTCVLDFSHNARSASHSDAAIEAFVDAGMRAIHASGPPAVGDWDQQWPADVVRLRDQYAASDESLIAVRLAVWGSTDLGGPQVAITPDSLTFARRHGIEVSVDAAWGLAASANIEELGHQGLLGPDVTLIHCTSFSDEAWRQIASSGTTISLCPTSDQQIGLASSVPPIQDACDHGVLPSLSVDIECSLSTDMFSQMRTILQTQRMMAFRRRWLGEDDAPEPITVRDVLRYATVGGATANGNLHRTGTLTPGKDADIVAIRANDVNTLPLNNAIGTVVLGADTASVDTVFVAGVARKWRRTLLGVDVARIRRLAEESRDYLFSQSGWTLDVLR